MKKQLYLVSDNNFPIKIHKSMIIGRDDLRSLSKNYKYVSGKQFKLEYDGNDWLIDTCADITNQNYLNGKQIMESIEIHNDDKILIGNIATRNGLTLKIILKNDVSKKRVKSFEDIYELNYNWLDYNHKHWTWGYCLPQNTVFESKKKFGLSKKVIGGKVMINPFENYSFTKRGLRKNGMTFLPDYNKITTDNVSLMKDVANSLNSLFKTEDKFKLLSNFLNFVQAIAYKIPPNVREDGKYTTGFLTPPELLYEHYGDCDSKAVLLASLWRNLFNDPIYFGIPKDHVFIGFSNINIPTHLENHTITVKGIKYSACEASGPGITYPGWIGKKYKINDFQILD